MEEDTTGVIQIRSHRTFTPAPDPVDVFRRLAGLPHVLFLDSAVRGGVRGRYSYITGWPIQRVWAQDGRVTVSVLDATGIDAPRYTPVKTVTGPPLRVLQDCLRPWKSVREEGLPPFQGGVAGLFGYGLSRSLERLSPPRRDTFRVPDLAIGIYDWVLAFDHQEDTCHLIGLDVPTPPCGPDVPPVAGRLAQLCERLEGHASGPAEGAGPLRSEPAAIPREDLAPHWPLAGSPDVVSNFSRDAFLAAIERAVEYIHAGDIFQVNLSQRLLTPLRASPLAFYLDLRRTNPAAFAAYFDLGDHVVASSSPEQFLTVERGHVVTRPIKGTRGRGATPETDRLQRAQLCESAKDRAENIMIVDLLRNDLSRVCRPGSVRASKLFELESHPTVHHLVSEVRGDLSPGRDALDLLQAAFPGGSITGAPKVRAMEIIQELEPTARGAYCGSLGYIAFHGDMSTSILIRTATASHGWIQFPVGGGIVADSNSADEYQETLDKAEGIIRALGCIG